jgi:hypothetical protein
MPHFELEYVLYETVMQHLLNEIILPANEIYYLETLCVAAVRTQSPAQFCLHWIRRHELGMRHFGDILSAVRLYTAALQQRIFLRTVLQEITGSILAGGFAAAQYKHVEMMIHGYL